ncbi:MAG: transposase [Thermodesulfovibrionales bacterium]
MRHLLLWEHPTYLRFTKYRVKCPKCGLKAERLPWLSFYGRVTQKLARLVYELCKVLTVQAISMLLFLHKDTIKGIDKKAIKEAHNSRPLDGVTVLGVDEMAIGKGHKYWHMIHALDGPRGPEKWALRSWEKWKSQLKWQRLEPYKKFARMIDRHIDGILACCDRYVPFGYIEATNLKARNIIRRAYGYRDKEYMKLKIIQGCSSLGVFKPWNFFNNSS